MTTNFDGVIGLPTSSTFIITSPLPEMLCERSNATRPLID